MEVASFHTQGFACIRQLVPLHACAEIAHRLDGADACAGVRDLLTQPWCVTLARQLRDDARLAPWLGQSRVAVQCTFFDKSPSRNWLVPIHQDLSVPVAERVDDEALRGWSRKDGALFVQAPPELLSSLIAVRLHLDDCGAEDGALRVVPASHLQGVIAPPAALARRALVPEVVCTAEVGDVLVMRPLLLHASSKATRVGRRRVLHFVFAPAEPGYGLRWSTAL